MMKNFDVNIKRSSLQGYDFGFLRISRLYEECSDATSYTWTTQYVGGNKLAICNSE